MVTPETDLEWCSVLSNGQEWNRKEQQQQQNHVVIFCPVSCICFSGIWAAGGDTLVFIKGYIGKGASENRTYGVNAVAD